MIQIFDKKLMSIYLTFALFNPNKNSSGGGGYKRSIQNTPLNSITSDVLVVFAIPLSSIGLKKIALVWKEPSTAAFICSAVQPMSSSRDCQKLSECHPGNIHTIFNPYMPSLYAWWYYNSCINTFHMLCCCIKTTEID